MTVNVNTHQKLSFFYTNFLTVIHVPSWCNGHFYSKCKHCCVQTWGMWHCTPMSNFLHKYSVVKFVTCWQFSNVLKLSTLVTVVKGRTKEIPSESTSGTIVFNVTMCKKYYFDKAAMKWSDCHSKFWVIISMISGR
jgi:hypothetical protein